MADPQVTFPCSVNSVPFWQANTARRNVDSAWNMGQQRYIDSLLKWQSKIPYNCKALFTDTLTFQFKTQQNSDLTVSATPFEINPSTYTYTNQAKLHVCKSKIGAFGYPVPGDIVSAFEADLNPTYGTCVNGSKFWGIQNPLFDTFTNPLTSYTQQLVSYMWSFSLGDHLSSTTDSGIYFLMFDNFDGTTHDIWYSEPILLYGTDALYTNTTDRTLLFQGQNTTDKSDILINATKLPYSAIPVTYTNGISYWFNNLYKFPLFNCRVEADILEYEPKGIYLGFLQENWLQENTLSSSWETFTLTIGSNTKGIPSVMFRIISKFIEFDLLTINNQFYMYDLGEGSGTPTAAWKMKKPRVKGLIAGTLPIRYKYPNQLFVNPLSTDYMIFGPQFDDTFA